MIKKWLRDKISKIYSDVNFDILIPPNDKMGDYSVNIIFSLAKKEGKSREEVADTVVQEFLNNKEFQEIFGKIEFAKPGFVNFYLSPDFLRDKIGLILKEKENFGSSKMGKGEKINLEFVSANPTGPLTVGNARSASYGDTLGNILSHAGFTVHKEYYINDVGVQIDNFTKSVINEEKVEKGEKPVFDVQKPYVHGVSDASGAVVDVLGNGLDKKDFKKVREESVKHMMKGIKRSVSSLGIGFDEWFSESKLHDKGTVTKRLQDLIDKGKTKEKEGATWLVYGEGKEAVLVKSDKSTSYLMNDIAYTKDKFDRGFDKAINIWGADHHGGVARLKAGVAALGFDENRLEILLHQLVNVKEGGEVKRMSKREGNLILADDLVEKTGKDVVRYFFLTKDLNTHMEFDIDLAKEQSSKNPVYYIQYAAARMYGILAKTLNSKYQILNKFKIQNSKNKTLELLREDEELRLMKDLVAFPDLIEDVARSYQVHYLAQYALSLATNFHKFYEKHHVILDDNEDLQNARLTLTQAVLNVLKVSLALMGISAPEEM
jgi:arginyl-tRNA synthetase